MSFRKLIGIIVLLGMAVSVSAQDRPGIDRPIRLGIFRGIGSGKYWHTSIIPGADAIKAFLANPTTSSLGADLTVPPAGFTTTLFGVTAQGAPSAAQVTTFINALDTLDVALIHCAVGVGAAISNTTERQKLANFWTTKGFITMHATTDSYNAWAPLDTIQGAQFQNHPSSDRRAKLYLDTLPSNENDSAYAILNKGLADTAFTEEWFSFTTSGAVIRAKPFLKVSVDIDEASYTGGLGGARAMGTDHPMSWFRPLPTGGRTFYTAVGHEQQNYVGGTANPRFLRRQIYNAVLWTSKYSDTGSVAIRYVKAPGDVSRYSHLSFSGNDLTVTTVQPGLHSVELLTLDGKRVASQTGMAQASHTFSNLHNGLYVVSVSTPAGRSTRLVAIQ